MTTTAVSTISSGSSPPEPAASSNAPSETRRSPTPPAQVRLRMHAVSLNFRDQLLLMGAYGGPPPIGDRVTSFYDPDWRDGPLPDGLLGPGAPGEQGFLAEYVVRDATSLVAAPHGVTMAEAATLPCAGVSAWTALYGNRPYSARPLGEGDTVVVLGSGATDRGALRHEGDGPRRPRRRREPGEHHAAAWREMHGKAAIKPPSQGWVDSSMSERRSSSSS